MDFIQPLLLLGSAAIAAPILLHLLFRPQPRVVELGTLRFLQELLRQHARRQRIKHWTLLLIRCLVLVVMAILFARPFARYLQPGATPGKLVLLIDASASMGRTADGRTLWQRALSEAERQLQQVPPEHQAVIAVFDHEAHAIRNESSAGSPLVASEAIAQLPALAGRVPGHGRTDYSTALQWALEQCAGGRDATRERVCLITDLQQAPTPALDAWPNDIDVDIIDVAPRGADQRNCSIREAVPSQSVLRPGQESTLSIHVRGERDAAESPVEARIDLRSGDRQSSVEHSISPGEDARQVPLPPLEPGLWQGKVALDHADAADFDDTRYFAVLVEPRFDVLLIDGSPDALTPASDAYFLEAAVRLAPGGQDYDLGPFRLTSISAAQPDALAELHRQQIAMLADVAAVDAAGAAKLVEFVQAGGGLLLFLGPNAAAAATSAWSESQIGIRDLRLQEAANGAPFQIQSWNAQHPIFAPFQDAERGALERVLFDRITDIKTSSDWQTLAKFHTGEPAILERTFGKGRILAVAAGPGPRSGNWPRSASYLPLVHQLLRYLVGRADPEPIRYATADFVQSPGISSTEGHWIVVNAASSESDLRPWTPLEFRQALALPLPSVEPAQTANKSGSQLSHDRQRPNEWWPWFAVALLGLLTFDTILANRVRF